MGELIAWISILLMIMGIYLGLPEKSKISKIVFYAGLLLGVIFLFITVFAMYEVD